MKSLHVSVLASSVGLALAASGGISTAAAPSISDSASVMSVAPSHGDANPSGRYFITFVEPGLARYNGGVAGIARTAPHVDGVSANSSRKFQINTIAAQDYKSYLASQRTQHIAAVQKAIGRSLDIQFTFDVTRNAVSAELTPAEAARIASVPGVASVKPVGSRQADTFRGPKFIGADKIWDGSAVPSYAPASRGFGVKVGVIDTGTNVGHPSFADDPMCGFNANNHKLHPRDCQSNDGTVCTGTAYDAAGTVGTGFGHGVHTSSTAAGNTIDNTATPAPLLPNGVTMSGVAPCASVYAYRVANNAGSIAGDYLEAAFQNAIVDQVDVVNYSIGPTCGGGNPWDEPEFLDMEAADIFVSASAGNTRTACPDPTGLVANNGPWEMTVAASTQDQQIGGNFQLDGPTPLPTSLADVVPVVPGSVGWGSSAPLANTPIKTYAANIAGCTNGGAIPAGTFTGAIAVMRRGPTNPGGTACGFAEKVNNAKAAGAVAVIVGNNTAGPLNMNTAGVTMPTIPAYGMPQAEANDLIDFVQTNANATADLSLLIQATQGDVLADFSFRGPTQAPYANLTKPDITGPGVNIYAALSTAEGSYGLMSGTSMSSPHVAGSAALIRAVQPSWSPMEVKSALQTTATLTGFQEDGTTPWTPDQVGSGRVDLTKAALAGLTMDESVDNFVAANPDGGSLDMSQLNLASLRNVYCTTTCTWTRKFRNRLNTSGSWTLSAAVAPPGYTLTIEPETFTLSPGFTQSVTITATATGEAPMTPSFGRIDMVEDNGKSPDQHLTVTAMDSPPTISANPTPLASVQDADTTQDVTLDVSNIGGGTLTWSFASTGTGAVWDQPDNGGGYGLVSSRSSSANNGAYDAVDFTTPIESSITKLTAYGFDLTGSLVADHRQVTWRIYKSINAADPDVIFKNGFETPVTVPDQPDGNPIGDVGTPVWEYTAASNATGVSVTGSGIIALDLAAAGQSLTLPAGTYWLTVFPTYPNAIATSGTKRWNWSMADQQQSPGKFTSDVVGGGAYTNWTDSASLTSNVIADFAFKVEGTVSCGAPWLTLSPTSGSAEHGEINAVTATFDSTGLANGDYTAKACISSNDPATPLLVVPVKLHVGPPQPIQDPSFELTTANGGPNPVWDGSDTNASAGGGTPFGSYGDARTGLWYVYFGGWGFTGDAAEIQDVSQTVTFPAAGPAYLNYWRFVGDAPDAAGTLTVSIDGTPVETSDMSAADADEDYVQRSIDVSAYVGGQHLVKFEYVYDDAGATATDGDIFIDDVTIDPTATSSAASAPHARSIQRSVRKTKR